MFNKLWFCNVYIFVHFLYHVTMVRKKMWKGMKAGFKHVIMVPLKI